MNKSMQTDSPASPGRLIALIDGHHALACTGEAAFALCRDVREALATGYPVLLIAPHPEEELARSLTGAADLAEVLADWETHQRAALRDYRRLRRRSLIVLDQVLRNPGHPGRTRLTRFSGGVLRDMTLADPAPEVDPALRALAHGLIQGDAIRRALTEDLLHLCVGGGEAQDPALWHAALHRQRELQTLMAEQNGLLLTELEAAQSLRQLMEENMALSLLYGGPALSEAPPAPTPAVAAVPAPPAQPAAPPGPGPREFEALMAGNALLRDQLRQMAEERDRDRQLVAERLLSDSASLRRWERNGAALGERLLADAAEIAQLRGSLGALLSSRSWRFTAPLRRRRTH